MQFEYFQAALGDSNMGFLNNSMCTSTTTSPDKEHVLAHNDLMWVKHSVACHIFNPCYMFPKILGNVIYLRKSLSTRYSPDHKSPDTC